MVGTNTGEVQLLLLESTVISKFLRAKGVVINSALLDSDLVLGSKLLKEPFSGEGLTSLQGNLVAVEDESRSVVNK